MSPNVNVLLQVKALSWSKNSSNCLDSGWYDVSNMTTGLYCTSRYS